MASIDTHKQNMIRLANDLADTNNYQKIHALLTKSADKIFHVLGDNRIIVDQQLLKTVKHQLDKLLIYKNNYDAELQGIDDKIILETKKLTVAQQHYNNLPITTKPQIRQNAQNKIDELNNNISLLQQRRDQINEITTNLETKAQELNNVINTALNDFEYDTPELVSESRSINISSFFVNPGKQAQGYHFCTHDGEQYQTIDMTIPGSYSTVKCYEIPIKTASGTTLKGYIDASTLTLSGSTIHTNNIIIYDKHGDLIYDLGNNINKIGENFGVLLSVGCEKNIGTPNVKLVHIKPINLQFTNKIDTSQLILLYDTINSTGILNNRIDSYYQQHYTDMKRRTLEAIIKKNIPNQIDQLNTQDKNDLIDSVILNLSSYDVTQTELKTQVKTLFTSKNFIGTTNDFEFFVVNELENKCHTGLEELLEKKITNNTTITALIQHILTQKQNILNRRDQSNRAYNIENHITNQRNNYLPTPALPNQTGWRKKTLIKIKTKYKNIFDIRQSTYLDHLNNHRLTTNEQFTLDGQRHESSIEVGFVANTTKNKTSDEQYINQASIVYNNQKLSYQATTTIDLIRSILRDRTIDDKKVRCGLALGVFKNIVQQSINTFGALSSSISPVYPGGQSFVEIKAGSPLQYIQTDIDATNNATTTVLFDETDFMNNNDHTIIANKLDSLWTYFNQIMNTKHTSYVSSITNPKLSTFSTQGIGMRRILRKLGLKKKINLDFSDIATEDGTKISFNKGVISITTADNKTFSNKNLEILMMIDDLKGKNIAITKTFYQQIIQKLFEHNNVKQHHFGVYDALTGQTYILYNNGTIGLINAGNISGLSQANPAGIITNAPVGSITLNEQQQKNLFGQPLLMGHVIQSMINII